MRGAGRAGKKTGRWAGEKRSVEDGGKEEKERVGRVVRIIYDARQQALYFLEHHHARLCGATGKSCTQ